MKKHNYIYNIYDENKEVIEKQFLLYNPAIYKWMVIDEIGYEIVDFLNDRTKEELINYLKDKYKIDNTIIDRDVTPFVDLLEKKGYLEESEDYKLGEINIDEKENYPFNDMYISLTNSCNLNCIYCFNKEKRLKKIRKNELYIDTLYVKKALVEFKELGGKNIVFTGGEPSLHKKLLEYAEIAYEIGLNPKMITNVINLKNIDMNKLFTYIKSVEFSIDSSNEDILNELWNCGKKDYLKDIILVFNAISNISNEKNRIKVIIAPVINKVNAESIIELINFVDNNLKNCEIGWNFTKYESIGNREADERLVISDEEFSTILLSIAKVLTGKDGSCKSENAKNAYEKLFAISSGGKKVAQNRKKGITCTPSFFLNVNGDVYICQGFDEDIDGYLGNIKDKSLDDMFGSDKFKCVRERLKIENVEECCDCELRYACAFKCVAKNRVDEKHDGCKSNMVYKMYLQSIMG